MDLKAANKIKGTKKSKKEEDLVEIVRGTYNINKKYPKPIITIGNFDGIHLGHQAIFQKVIEKAKETGGTSIVFTFEPHPVKFLAPSKWFPILTPFKEKINLLKSWGIDVIICANFNEKFAQQEAQKFVENLLYQKLHIEEIYVGHDYAFGKGKKGTIPILKQLGQKFNFEVTVIPPVKIDDQIISSSYIRNLLKEGDVAKASICLNRPYSIKGKVVKGSSRGKKLGYPTANFLPLREVIPHNGVYIVKVKKNNQQYNGIANIGYHPTFKDKTLNVEVHLFDFNEDIYGKLIEIDFIDKLRNEIAFANAQQLIKQIQKDIEIAKKIMQL